MAKFKLVREDGPDACFSYGAEFKKGEASEISDPVLAEKARNNPHFEEVKSGPKPKSSDGDKG